MGEVIAMCWKDILKKDGCGCMTQKSEDKKAKPDYIDLDGDGNRKESMKQAAKDKKSKKRSAFTAGD